MARFPVPEGSRSRERNRVADVVVRRRLTAGMHRWASREGNDVPSDARLVVGTRPRGTQPADRAEHARQGEGRSQIASRHTSPPSPNRHFKCGASAAGAILHPSASSAPREVKRSSRNRKSTLTGSNAAKALAERIQDEVEAAHRALTPPDASLTSSVVPRTITAFTDQQMA